MADGSYAASPAAGEAIGPRVSGGSMWDEKTLSDFLLVPMLCAGMEHPYSVPTQERWYQIKKVSPGYRALLAWNVSGNRGFGCG